MWLSWGCWFVGYNQCVAVDGVNPQIGMERGLVDRGILCQFGPPVVSIHFATTESGFVVKSQSHNAPPSNQRRLGSGFSLARCAARGDAEPRRPSTPNGRAHELPRESKTEPCCQSACDGANAQACQDKSRHEHFQDQQDHGRSQPQMPRFPVHETRIRMMPCISKCTSFGCRHRRPYSRRLKDVVSVDGSLSSSCPDCVSDCQGGVELVVCCWLVWPAGVTCC